MKELSEVIGNICWLSGSHLAAPPRGLGQSPSSSRAENPDLVKGSQAYADLSSLCPTLSVSSSPANQSPSHSHLSSSIQVSQPFSWPGFSYRKIRKNKNSNTTLHFQWHWKYPLFGIKPFSFSDREVENDLLLGAQPGFLRKQQIKRCSSNEGWHWGRVGVWLLLCFPLLLLPAVPAWADSSNATQTICSGCSSKLHPACRYP